MILNRLIRLARDFACRHHVNQTRLDSVKSPLTNHLLEVALLVEFSGGTEVEIAAAWLHDTVEDTSATIDDIKMVFGEDMAHIIEGLTDPEEFKKLGTESRKKLQADRLITKNRSVKKIKLADQISNVRSIAIDPPTEWGRQKCIDYIVGAKLVARQCQGISGFLDNQFEKALTVVKKIYGLK